VLVLIAGVVACEAAGWPFLAKPVERSLTKLLQREVRLGDGGTSAHATVRFFGALKVQVPTLQIGAPEWSRQPYFLRAEGANMRLAYGALWRAKDGAPLDIEQLTAEQLVVHAERLMDGRASWAFGDPNAQKQPADTPMALPTVQELRVTKGQLTFVDAPLKADIVAELQLAEGTAPAGSQPLPEAFKGLIANARGTYGPAKISADLRTSGATPLLHTGKGAAPVPVTLELKANHASLDFKGTVTDVLKLANMSGVFKVTGPSLAAAGDPLGVTLPTTGPFVLQGRMAKTGDVWNVVTDEATVGSSELRAALTYDMRPRVPLLSGRVTGPRLLLADLAPTIGGEPGAAAAPPAAASAPPSARVLPDKEFDLPALRAMNANVIFDFDRVELGELFALPLQPLKTHLTLQDGKLRLSDLVARTADGNVAGDIALDGTGHVAFWQADLRWSGVQLEKWVKQARANDAPPYVSGRLVGRAALKGQGRSTAQILGSLDGTVVTSLRNGKISHLAVEGAGIDIAQALGILVKGDAQLPVSCALADMTAEKGVLRPRAFVIDTPDSTVWADGSVSLKDEVLDVRAVVTPKDFSPLALRTPIHVKGPFKAPGISLKKAPLARKLGAAALLSLVNPFAALIPFIDTGHRDEDGPDSCAELLDKARQAAAAESPNDKTADSTKKAEKKS